MTWLIINRSLFRLCCSFNWGEHVLLHHPIAMLINVHAVFVPVVMWKELIRRNGGVVTSALDLSSLAKISDGYTQGHMVRVVKGILTERRIQQIAKRPLTTTEFVSPLATIDPVFQDEEEALKVMRWWDHYGPWSKRHSLVCNSDLFFFFHRAGTLRLLWVRRERQQR